MAASADIQARSPQLLVRTAGLGRSFGKEKIISDLDLQLPSGNSLAVVSPSGSGKSTLLAIIGLLLNKSEGELEVCGQNVREMSAASKARVRRLQIGFVFQHTQLIGSLRAIDNVLLGADLLHRSDAAHLAARQLPGVGSKSWPTRAEELLCGFGLERRLHHFPHQLSVGQKRRVAVARALLLAPPLLIADEPTNDLDSASATLVAEALFATPATGTALLLATHDLALAQRAGGIVELRPQ